MKKFNKYIIFCAVSGFVLVIGCVGIGLFGRTPTEAHFFDTLKAHDWIAEERVPITSLTGFDWDTVCVLSPYSVAHHTNPSQIQKMIQADLSTYGRKFPVLEDNMWAFVFIKDSSIIEIISNRRERFEANYDSNCMGNGAELVLAPHSTYVIKETKQEIPSCSIHDAEYRPHPKYKSARFDQLNELDFAMTLQPPLEGEKGGSFRSIFFYIDAFHRQSGEKVSTIRMSDTCSNGAVVCGISTNEGQFRRNEDKKDLKDGIAFEPIALDSDFYRVPYNGDIAPAAFILPNTASKIYYAKNRTTFTEVIPEFVKFYTDEKLFPDFSGYDVWLLNSCKGTTNIKQPTGE